MGKMARETYIQIIIRLELMLNALQINKKNYTLSAFPLSNRQNFEDCGRVLVVSVSEYCSSALPSRAYKMVITTVNSFRSSYIFSFTV